MKSVIIITLLLCFMITHIEGRKTSRSRSSGSGRGSNRKTNYNPQPVPTSLSYPQPAASKPSSFGWQEKPVQRAQSTSSRASKPSNGQSHSYPSSQTGLSGSNQPKQPPTYQESIQRSNIPHSLQGQQSQPSHSYPSSNGLSGGSNVGANYPQQYGNGLSGSGGAPPQYPGYKPGDINRQHSAGNYPTNNFGNNNNYYHPQGPPPPYSSPNNYGHFGANSYGSYNPGYSPSMPGYFGNYGKGFGGVSRTGSALTGVGIAGAGVGTLLTGLALWNLARSTGQHHHTVIYDNRGQPVAVAPNNGTASPIDSILGELVNCSLTISNLNATEILAIPCSIATSFTPDADVKDINTNNNSHDGTKCTVTVLTKTGKEYMTTIPCSLLLNTAAENNVTEPPLLVNTTESVNGTIVAPNDALYSNQPSALTLSGHDTSIDLNNVTSLNCTPQPGDDRDPINSCLPVTNNLTVIPLESINNNSTLLSTSA